MAEAIAALLSDPDTPLVQPRYVVIFAPKKNRKRFPEGCVTVCDCEADAINTARPQAHLHAAIASGPSRSSEGFHLYYLVRWLD